MPSVFLVRSVVAQVVAICPSWQRPTSNFGAFSVKFVVGSGTGTGSFVSALVFYVIVIPPMLHTHILSLAVGVA